MLAHTLYLTDPRDGLLYRIEAHTNTLNIDRDGIDRSQRHYFCFENSTDTIIFKSLSHPGLDDCLFHRKAKVQNYRRRA